MCSVANGLNIIMAIVTIMILYLKPRTSYVSGLSAPSALPTVSAPVQAVMMASHAARYDDNSDLELSI